MFHGDNVANEIFWSSIQSASERQLFLSTVLMALGDAGAVPNHPVLGGMTDLTGTNSDSVKTREDNLNGATSLSTISESGNWANTAYSVTNYEVAVAQYYKQFTLSDLARMVNDGQLDMQRFLADYMKAEARTWTGLLATVGATFSNTGSDTGAAPNMDDIVTANYALDALYAPGGTRMALLHPKQVYQLKSDAAFSQSNNYTGLRDPEAAAIAKATGGVYAGRYDNVDIFQSWQVPTSGGKYIGCIIAPGAIARAYGVPVADGSVQSATFGRLRFSQERDSTGPRSALRCDTFMGLAKQQEAGVLFKSPT